MAKIYKYKDSLYCEDDLSERYEQYRGDLYDLFLVLRDDGMATENTTYSVDPYSKQYGDEMELIENEYSDLCIGESED